MKNTKQILVLLTLCLFAFTVTDVIAQQAPASPRHKHARHHKGGQPHHFWNNLPEAEKERFQKIYKENPAAFHEEVRKYWKKEFEKYKQEMDELGKRYHATEDEAAKEQIKQELRAKIAQGFERHLRYTEKHIQSYEAKIQQMQKRLERLKKQTEVKKQNKDADIDKTVQKILDSAKAK